ncbi:hypothetical protein PACTADRAFT_50002 [Pachysolen tannophilus NRRL Y-2460]|uniref:DNA replication regulator Sld3 C-terminal domain-containing protein n=1 Tax=Pachysolen tannophilus NRRL Y-2460 TaxID=669874 RepID=A0A1E4TU22_PACTA|nr:hypothetical protein PACTADRAFT_50002 [Pachysolen tannophilus NRRL Y-2460]
MNHITSKEASDSNEGDGVVETNDMIVEQLPKSFKVVPSSYKSRLTPLYITPIRPFKIALNYLDEILSNTFSNSNQHITLLRLDKLTDMHWKRGSSQWTYYVKIQKDSGSTPSYKLGILFNVADDSWGIYYLNKELKLKIFKCLEQESNKDVENANFFVNKGKEELVPIDEKDLKINMDIDLLGFNMSPPSSQLRLKPGSELTEKLEMTNINTPSTSEETSSLSPLMYIEEKYFATLYSNTNLMFFVKSSFARLRFLCGSDLNKVQQSLSALIIDIEFLKKKYNGSTNFLTQDDIGISKTESSYKRNYLVKLNVLETGKKNDHSLKLAQNSLKIREVQLQMLMLMELLIIINSKEEKQNEKIQLQQTESETKKEQKQTQIRRKPSLVRRKSAKAKQNLKMIPTLSGTLVSIYENEADTLTNTQTNVASFSNQYIDDIVLLTTDAITIQINKYLDLLMVLESLSFEVPIISSSSTSSTINNSGSDTPSNILDFLTNIIIPYYYKKLTPLCKKLISTVKGVGIKRKHRSHKKDNPSKLAPPIKLAASAVDLKRQPTTVNDANSFMTLSRGHSQLDDLMNNDNDKFNKINMERGRKLPTLKRSSSTKLLEKRTVDLTIGPSASTNINTSTLNGNNNNNTNSFVHPRDDFTKEETNSKSKKGIFGTSIITNNNDNGKNNNKSERQSVKEIDATPVKKVQGFTFSNSKISYGNMSNGKSFNDKMLEIVSTPDDKLTSRNNMEIVSSTSAGHHDRQEDDDNNNIHLTERSKALGRLPTFKIPVVKTNNVNSSGGGHARGQNYETILSSSPITQRMNTSGNNLEPHTSTSITSPPMPYTKSSPVAVASNPSALSSSALPDSRDNSDHLLIVGKSKKRTLKASSKYNSLNKKTRISTSAEAKNHFHESMDKSDDNELIPSLPLISYSNKRASLTRPGQPISVLESPMITRKKLIDDRRKESYDDREIYGSPSQSKKRKT